MKTGRSSAVASIQPHVDRQKQAESLLLMQREGGRQGFSGRSLYRIDEFQLLRSLSASSQDP
jgi:hypothetical protein